jgi:LAS superfamily LD-carboxypeptidase LdcB
LIDLDFLTGKNTDQLTNFTSTTHLVHREMLASLTNLFQAAKLEGFELAMTSAFRSYDSQKTIWNEKVEGKRAVLDSHSNNIDLTTKSPEEILFAILRWSAIPGGSRHHWGCDIDIFDQSALMENSKPLLVPAEYELTGPFYQSTLWLSEKMGDYGFFRPYQSDNGGILPEPWHLSFRPLSEIFLKQFSYQMFVDHLNASDFLLKKEAIQNSSEIYHRFIRIDKN